MLTLDELITASRQTKTHVVEGGKDFSQRKVDKISEMASRISAPMDRPLQRTHRERLQRKASYKAISNDISRWLPAIADNRRSNTLTLATVQGAPLSLPSITVENMEPETPLEQEMEAVLGEGKLSGKLVMKFDENVQNEEEGYEAANNRQIELQKLRSFLFFQQQKSKRVAKIKSKVFHKVHKKEKKPQVDPLRAEIERAKARIEEGNKRQRILSACEHQSKIDGEKRVETLKKLIYSEEEEEDKSNQLEEEVPKSALFSLKFMKKHHEVISDDECEELNDEEKQAGELTEDEESEEEVFGKKTFSKQSKTPLQTQEEKKAFLSLFNSEEEAFKRQKTLITEAFQFDKKEEEEFLKEKFETIEEELPKPFIDAALPGWGSWGGHGASPSTKHHFIANPDKTARAGVKKEQRRDASLSHVIIREKRPPKQYEKKYQIEKVPYPYENEAQFSAANYLMPVGREWNPVSIVEEKLRPKISQQLNGIVIKPLPFRRKA